MAYAAVDPVITAWVKTHGLRLFTQFGGKAARFAYVTGRAQECFQLSIKAPLDERVRVHAGSVETVDDRDLCAFWIVPVGDLGATLDLALKTIETWSDRPKGPATWQPPASWHRSP